MSSDNVDLPNVVYLECHRGFKRTSDLKRHKCIAERVKPIHEQKGAIECQSYMQYFRSKGDYAIRKRVDIYGKTFL